MTINKKYFKEIIDFMEKKDLIMDMIIIERDQNQEIIFKKPNINVKVQTTFKREFLKKFNNIDKDFDKKEFEEYKEESKSGPIFYLKEDEILSKQLIKKEIVDFEVLENFQEVLKNGIWGLLFNFKDSQGHFLRIFFKYKESMFLKRSLFHALTFLEESLVFLEKDVLSYNFTIHSFFFNQLLLILNKYNTELLFDFQRLFKHKATETLNEVEKLPFKIKNFNLWKKKCMEVPSMARKLTNISRKKYYQKLTFENVKKIVKEFNLNLKLDEVNEIIEIPKYKNIWDFLHILDDSYLKSEITDNKYEASVKKEK